MQFPRRIDSGDSPWYYQAVQIIAIKMTGRIIFKEKIIVFHPLGNVTWLVQPAAVNKKESFKILAKDFIFMKRVLKNH